jgi:hypothetical protein
MDGWIRMEAFWLGKRLDKVRVLDPMAGVGRVHRLPGKTFGVELEAEWADQANGPMYVGDCRQLPWRRNSFDVIAVSPCLEQSHRMLTNDLRWKAAGDIVEGDELLAFNESGQPGVGTASRRRWERSTVVRSEPMSVPCVRVILENGDEVITTPNHPWLAYRYSYGGRSAEWVASEDLMGSPGAGTTRGHRAGRRQPYYVMRQVEPWTERTSKDAGWLAGMFDGEGSLSLGWHGSPKMTLTQVEGPVIDHAEDLMERFGYAPNRIARTDNVEHRQKVANLYVTGGFPGMLRALGELRPMRLLSKWETLDVASRTVWAEKVRVEAVEPCGVRDIQGIETTSGTYIGEGYLHHNTYGNRMADHHNAQDGSVRHSYTHDLGRRLTPGNSGELHWGFGYKKFHVEAWTEAVRVLRPGGLFLLNVSDHVRKREVVPVSAWHCDVMKYLGGKCFARRDVETRRLRKGQNHAARVDCEHVFAFRF